MGQLLLVLKKNSTEAQIDDLVKKILTLCTNRTYAKRQLFCRCCEHCLTTLPVEMFKEIFWKPLMELRTDPISNVRLVLARIVDRSFRNNDEFKDDEELKETIKAFQNEKEDVDVIRLFVTEEELKKWLTEYEERKQEMLQFHSEG